MLLILAAFAIIGCKGKEGNHPLPNYTHKNGNISPFLHSNILKYAYSSTGFRALDGLPEISTTWAYSEDEQGTQIHTLSEDYQSIFRLLTNVIGEPASVQVTSNGFFSVSKNGIAMTFNVYGTNLHLIFLKPKRG